MSKTELKEATALSRGAILEADDIAVEAVPVPEWGGTVYVRCMTGEQRDAWEQSHQDIKWKGSKVDKIVRVGNPRARGLVHCLVHRDGAPLFKPEDAAALGAKSGKVIDRLWEVAARLSGIRDEDLEEAKGNSASGHSAASSSSSPETTG